MDTPDGWAKLQRCVDCPRWRLVSQFDTAAPGQFDALLSVVRRATEAEASHEPLELELQL